MSNFLATILGIPEFPSIREVNVRSGPAVTRELMFKVPLGQQGFVRAVETDADNSAFGGKVYSWCRLEFHDGRNGWVRDDLIEVEGDGAAFGYGFVPQRIQAFKLVREIAAAMTTPAAPVTPISPDTPSGPAAPSAPVAPDSVMVGIALTTGRDGVNVRRGPGINHEAITRFTLRTRCEILDCSPEDNRGSRFRWVQLKANGTAGWVREDFLRYDGDVSKFGLAFADAYPAPLHNSWWVRDWNTDPNFAAIHYGWDIGAATGEPVLAGPTGGLVIQTVKCQLCTPEKPNVLANGLRLNDPGVLQNPAWGFGYGNYVVVRYLFEQLPASTQAELARRNLPGYHIFAIYAHLNSIDVQQGQTVQPNQKIGTCGNTGNSEAAHLHLELRAWNNANETNYGRMIANRIDPVVLFRR